MQFGVSRGGGIRCGRTGSVESVTRDGVSDDPMSAGVGGGGGDLRANSRCGSVSSVLVGSFTTANKSADCDNKHCGNGSEKTTTICSWGQQVERISDSRHIQSSKLKCSQKREAGYTSLFGSSESAPCFGRRFDKFIMASQDAITNIASTMSFADASQTNEDFELTDSSLKDSFKAASVVSDTTTVAFLETELTTELSQPGHLHCQRRPLVVDTSFIKSLTTNLCDSLEEPLKTFTDLDNTNCDDSHSRSKQDMWKVNNFIVPLQPETCTRTKSRPLSWLNANSHTTQNTEQNVVTEYTFPALEPLSATEMDCSRVRFSFDSKDLPAGERNNETRLPKEPHPSKRRAIRAVGGESSLTRRHSQSPDSTVGEAMSPSLDKEKLRTPNKVALIPTTVVIDWPSSEHPESSDIKHGTGFNGNHGSSNDKNRFLQLPRPTRSTRSRLPFLKSHQSFPWMKQMKNSTAKFSKLCHRDRNGPSSALQREIKAARQLGVIMGAFTVCFLPYFVCFTVVAFCDWCIGTELMTAVTWVGYLNSTLNPFLYPLCNLSFRRKFRKMLHLSGGQQPSISTASGIGQIGYQQTSQSIR